MRLAAGAWKAKRGGDLGKPRARRESSPLDKAAARGEPDRVRELLGKGERSDERFADGSTPLLRALARLLSEEEAARRLRALELLLEAFDFKREQAATQSLMEQALRARERGAVPEDFLSRMLSRWSQASPGAFQRMARAESFPYEALSARTLEQLADAGAWPGAQDLARAFSFYCLDTRPLAQQRARLLAARAMRLPDPMAYAAFDDLLESPPRAPCPAAGVRIQTPEGVIKGDVALGKVLNVTALGNGSLVSLLGEIRAWIRAGHEREQLRAMEVSKASEEQSVRSRGARL